MDSKSRRVEIKVWNYNFFCQLNHTERLFYWFLITNCDNIGVYNHNPKLVEFHCGEGIELHSFVNTINSEKEYIEILDNCSVWIKHFIRDTWGTIAANNNLGLSCYKLLVKYELLDRFIEEQPNNINVSSFRESILNNKKGYGDLPLPQGSIKPDPKLGQKRSKAGTINNTINSNDNNRDETSLEFEMRSKGLIEDTPF